MTRGKEGDAIEFSLDSSTQPEAPRITSDYWERFDAEMDVVRSRYNEQHPDDNGNGPKDPRITNTFWVRFDAELGNIREIYNRRHPDFESIPRE